MHSSLFYPLRHTSARFFVVVCVNLLILKLVPAPAYAHQCCIPRDRFLVYPAAFADCRNIIRCPGNSFNWSIDGNPLSLSQLCLMCVKRKPPFLSTKLCMYNCDISLPHALLVFFFFFPGRWKSALPRNCSTSSPATLIKSDENGPEDCGGWGFHQEWSLLGQLMDRSWRWWS